MRRYLAVVAVILAALAGSGTPAQAQSASRCGWPGVTDQIGISSTANGLLVSAEINRSGNFYGMLRARGIEAGPWEQYDLICVQSPDVYAIKSRANNRYVSAELRLGGNSNGLLRARAVRIGPWEQFRMYPEAGSTTIQSVANGQFVSTELSWSGINNGSLRARATSSGPWEDYQIINEPISP